MLLEEEREGDDQDSQSFTELAEDLNLTLRVSLGEGKERHSRAGKLLSRGRAQTR